MPSSKLIVSMLIAVAESLSMNGVATWGAEAQDDPIMRMLIARVERAPTHSDSWRLLGKTQADRGDTASAFSSLSRALELDPSNAAAHFSLGVVLQDQGQNDAAAMHFRRCVEIAPESDYATEIFAQQFLIAPVLDTNEGMIASDSLTVQPASFEIQTFDGADDLNRRFDQLESDAELPPKRLRLFCELGVLYNSNVSLTPISRELFNVDAESFQAIFNPEIEWIAVRDVKWRTGPLLRSYSTVNESYQQAFNLFSVQPGWFIERDCLVGDSECIARVDYIYATDLLDGTRIGDRHGTTASVIIIRPDLDVIHAYLSASYADFTDDGVLPDETSLDGPTVTGGVSRYFQTGLGWFPNYSLGVDLESTDTRGSDFRYRAITTHGGMTFRLSERWQFIPNGGIGYRDYYAFTGAPSRDEFTARIQAKLQCQLNTLTSLSLVSGYDRFASDNDFFDAERYQGGILTTVNY